MGTTKSDLQTGYDRARQMGVGVEPGAGANRAGMPSTQPFDDLVSLGGKVGKAILGGLDKINSIGRHTPKPQSR